MRRNRIRHFGWLFDLIDGNNDFGWNFLVQFHILLELRHDGTQQRLQFFIINSRIRNFRDGGFHEAFFNINLVDLNARATLNQNLYGAIGQFQELQDRSDRADRKQVIRARIVLTGAFLGHQQDLFAVVHHVFERMNRFFAANEQRNYHVRENNNIP